MARISRGQSHDRPMAVHSPYYLPKVDVPLHRLLEPTSDERAYRKWLTLLPVFLISAIALALVLWAVFIGVDFAMRSLADVHAGR
jgi:hypothetical protein